MATTAFKLLKITRPSPFVVEVQLNRPQTRNSLNKALWTEFGQCFDYLSTDVDCRVILLTGAGKTFCAGLDFQELMSFGQNSSEGQEDVARKAINLQRFIKQFQECFTSIEKCPKPVIASIHGGAIGAGMDLIVACDIRYASKEAFFSIREVNIGITADIGTLQRLPKVVGNDSWVRELAYTARDFGTEEALRNGLLSRVFSSPEELYKSSLELAKQIAAKSPVAVQGTKINLNYARDHTVQEGLDFGANWNMCFLQSEDAAIAAMAAATRQKELPTFSKL